MMIRSTTAVSRCHAVALGQRISSVVKLPLTPDGVWDAGQLEDDARRGLQRLWSEQAAKTTLYELLRPFIPSNPARQNQEQREQRDRRCARVRSLAADPAFHLSDPPYSVHSTIDPDVFRIATRLRLGAKLPRPVACVCGTTTNSYDHWLHCSAAKDVELTNRHNIITLAAAEICESISHTAALEITQPLPRGQSGPVMVRRRRGQGSVRPDLVVRSPAGRLYWLDVSITSPTVALPTPTS
jgi:hypothetical protein